jgi:hypothetical protein
VHFRSVGRFACVLFLIFPFSFILLMIITNTISIFGSARRSGKKASCRNSAPHYGIAMVPQAPKSPPLQNIPSPLPTGAQTCIATDQRTGTVHARTATARPYSDIAISPCSTSRIASPKRRQLTALAAAAAATLLSLCRRSTPRCTHVLSTHEVLTTTCRIFATHTQTGAR